MPLCRSENQLHVCSEMAGKRWRKRSRSVPTICKSPPNRPPVRKQWSDAQMCAAMKAVRDGTMSANKAAIAHGVPRSSLKDRLSGRVEHGTKPGPRPYLSPEEEKDHVLTAAEAGYGKTRREIKIIAENIAREKGILKTWKITDGWWQMFLKRNPRFDCVVVTLRLTCGWTRSTRKLFKAISHF